MAVDGAHQHVFLSAGPGTSSIVVLDYAGNIVDTITGEPGASEMALDPATHTLYVALHDATAISAIDTDTLTETSRFSTAPYPGPYNLVLGGGKLFFACAAGSSGQNCPTDNGGGVVSVYPDGTGMAASIGGYFFMTMLAAGGPGNDLLAVKNSYAGSAMATYDLTTDPPSLIASSSGPADVPGDASDMAFDPSGSSLLVAGAELNTDTLLPSFVYPNGGQSSQMTADGDFVVEGGADETQATDLFVYPVDDTTPVKTWTLGLYIAPHAVAFSPDRSLLFAVSGDSGGLSFNVISNPVPDTPSVSTGPVDQSGSTAATLNGSVNPEGLATTYHFEYGTNTAYGTSTAATSAGSGNAPVPVSAPISGLTAGTTYHFRLVATNSAGTTKAPDATFTAIPESPEVVDEGPGTGTITSSPAGIDCGNGETACGATFTTGSSVTLTATPDQFSAFTGWGGDCSGKGSCTLTMSSARSVKAIFAPLKTLTVSEPGNGLGTVTSVPAGINCGLTCSAQYAQGTSVSLTATAGADSTFTGWSGACSGTGQCTVQMNADTGVNANFTGPDQRLTVTEAGDGSGTVTSDPTGIDCGSVCSTPFPTGSSVTLTATAATGSAFTGWSNACTGTQPTCTVTMDMAHSVTANFAPQETLTVSKNGDGKGMVTSSPTGIHCGSKCVFSYVQGTFLTLTATASRGSKFTGWSGACGGPGNCQVQLTASSSAIATFRAQCVIPNVVGLSLRVARTRLANARCSLGTVTRAFSNSIQKGRVVSQRPHPHGVHARGTKVRVVVSRGR
jgi:uncharacterized repeat protein (TIGR02543 family)